MAFFIKIFFSLKNFLFPSACVLCGANLIGADEIQYSLCKQCRISIVPIQGHKCLVCGKPLISENGICIPCRNIKERSFDRLWVLYPYTGKYRKLLGFYKFSKNLELSAFFAKKIIELIANEAILKDAVIVPVPPRPGKIKHSGWDQIDYLIKQMEKISGCLPVNRCLKRRKSKVQKHLNRTERLENLKGRIFIKGAVPKIALIVDDVITTGSTIEVCAQTLKQGGAEKVLGLCLFYD